MIKIKNEHRLPLTDLEVEMLISSYETKLRKIVKPLQKFETGLSLDRYRNNNNLKKCYEVNFRTHMNDHNYRVDLGTPDSLTDVVYKRRFRQPHLYREWYLPEIRHRYNECYSRIMQLAQYVGYDYSHLKGRLNFTEDDKKSMDHFREVNANKYVGEDGWEGF